MNWVRSFVNLALIVLLSVPVWAAKDPKPLPPVTEVKSTIQSSDQAIDKIYVGNDQLIPIPETLGSKLRFEPDLINVEVKAIYSLINDTTQANSEKSISLLRYTTGDERIAEALIAAKAAGIAVEFITDFNPNFTADFKAEEKYVTDVTRMKLNQSESAGVKFIKRLLEKGFVLGKEIISQPLFNPALNERIPIMHEKALLLRSGPKKVSYFGTANLSGNSRINRLHRVIDPLFYDAYLAHANALKTNYLAGQKTSKMPTTPRTRIVYQDGTHLEMCFSDGKYNPNDRILQNLENNLMTDALLSEFVITHRPVVNAIRSAMEKNPEAKMLVVSDDRFSETNGWGLLAAFDGFDVNSPFNNTFEGFSENIWTRIDSFVYQRKATDPLTGEEIAELSTDGPPVSRFLWHDKTAVFHLTDPEGKSFALMYTGSFNLSNNAANSEFQAEIKSSKDSWLIQATEFSVKAIIKSQPEYALDSLTATIRNSLARVFGLTSLEVSVADARSLEDAIAKRDFVQIKTILQKVSQAKTELRKTVPQYKRLDRYQKLTRFLEWYFANVPASNSLREVKIRRFLGLANFITDQNINRLQRSRFLEALIQRDGLSIEQKNQLIFAGSQILDNQGGKADANLQPTNLFKLDAPFNGQEAISFDWDDTVMRMPTKIILFSKTEPPVAHEVSTEEYAMVRKMLGQPGPWENYEIRRDANFNSFKYFSTDPEQKYFIKDIRSALARGEESWHSAMTDKFFETLQDPRAAKIVSIITARAADPEEILEGLNVLKEYYEGKVGKKIYLPKLENIITVGKAADSSSEKAAQARLLLDRLFKIGIKKWLFYDDDSGNIEKMQKMIATEKNRWPGMQLKTELVHKVHAPAVLMCLGILIR